MSQASLENSCVRAGGKIDALLTGFKNSLLASALVQAQFSPFKSQAHSLTPSWFVLGGPGQWSLSPGGLYVQPYELYNGFVGYAG